MSIGSVILGMGFLRFAIIHDVTPKSIGGYRLFVAVNRMAERKAVDCISVQSICRIGASGGRSALVVLPISRRIRIQNQTIMNGFGIK